MSCVKTLCECVLEGFTRETLSRVVKYDHAPWENKLNTCVRRNPTDWDKVQEFALNMAMEHIQTHEDEGLSTLIDKHIL